VTAISPAPPGAARPGSQEIALVTSTIDRFMLGIEMTSVDAIEESQGMEEVDSPVLDIMKLWDLHGRCADDEGGSRRVIALRTASGRCRLLVGSRAEVIGIPAESLLPLPTFLEEVGRRAAISALFVTESGFGVLLDADRVDLSRRDVCGEDGGSTS
jgi:hypothetical protein